MSSVIAFVYGFQGLFVVSVVLICLPQLYQPRAHRRCICLPQARLGEADYGTRCMKTTRLAAPRWLLSKPPSKCNHPGYRMLHSSSPSRWLASPSHPSGWRYNAKPRSKGTDDASTDSARYRDIHILGLGNIGKFVAHCLSTSQGAPPLHLLWANKLYQDHWYQEGQRIRMMEYDSEFTSSGYKFEAVHDVHNNKPIDNLIVCSKAGATVKALQSVSGRLHQDSSILFLQNGMGMVENVNAEVFPDVRTRPWYSVGITTHGVHSQSSWTIVHAGYGTTHLATMPRAISHPEEKQTGLVDHPGRFILGHLQMSPILTALELPYEKMLQFQWEKLAINAVINPISVMLNCHNGDVAKNMDALELGLRIVTEISTVVKALPELQGFSYLEDRFEPDRLMDSVANVAYNTAYNLSSMLQDVRLGRKTEIEYINGYIFRRGAALGIPCPVNQTMVELVRARCRLIHGRRRDVIPVEAEPRDVGAVTRRRQEMRKVGGDQKGESKTGRDILSGGGVA